MAELVDNGGMPAFTKSNALLLFHNVVGRKRTHDQACVINTLNDIDRGNTVAIGHDAREMNIPINRQRPQQFILPGGQVRRPRLVHDHVVGDWSGDVERAEVDKSELPAQSRQSVNRHLRLAHAAEHLDDGAGIIGVSFQRQGHVACDQKMALGNLVHLALEGGRLNPGTQHQNGHGCHDHENDHQKCT